MRINISFQCSSSAVIDFSARELASYLKRMLPDSLVTINNGQGSADLTIQLESQAEAAAENDHYSIHIENSRGLILGNGDRSVLLGVYYYLHLLGCRFLAPGARHELVPVLNKKEKLFVHCEKTAVLRHRGVCIEGANSLDNILDFIDWLPKLGYNSFFLQFKLPYTFLARWYHHELNPLLKPETFTLKDAKKLTKSIEDSIRLRGLLLHQAGHGWTGEVLGYPSADWKAVSSPLSEEQESLTALVSGKRRLFHGVPMNTNLCYSNPRVTETFTNQVLSYIKEHPETDYLHIWLADEYNNICECENCRKTTPSDQYVRLLNQIDRKLTSLGIRTKIVFLLYQELLWPPCRERLENPDRFVLMFAPISRTFERSYELKDSPEPIPAYIRNKVVLPVNLDENMSFLRAWQDIFSGDSFIYDYPLGRAHYGDLGYIHIARIIGEDIRKLKSMGLNGYISCQELRASFPNAFPGYVLGRMLFDQDCTFEELETEYFKAAYGPDWKKVLDYLTRISSLCSCDYFNGKGDRMDPQIAKSMAALIKQFEEEPENSWPVSSPANLFWKYLDYHREYGLRLGKALLYLSEGRRHMAQQHWHDFQHMICEMEPCFQQCLDVYRITEVSTKYTGFCLEERLSRTL